MSLSQRPVSPAQNIKGCSLTSAAILQSINMLSQYLPHIPHELFLWLRITSKHIFRKTVSIGFQHIPQFHGIARVHTAAPCKPSISLSIRSLWHLCGNEPVRKISSCSPQVRVYINSYTSPSPGGTGFCVLQQRREFARMGPRSVGLEGT